MGTGPARLAQLIPQRGRCAGVSLRAVRNSLLSDTGGRGASSHRRLRWGGIPWAREVAPSVVGASSLFRAKGAVVAGKRSYLFLYVFVCVYFYFYFFFYVYFLLLHLLLL